MEIAKKWLSIFGIVVITLLTIDVVVLSVKNQELKDFIREITSFEPPEPLELGTHVESIPVTLLDGRNDTISYDHSNSQYLLFIFSTTCPHCEANIPRWRSVKDKSDGNCFVIAISLHNVERTTEFVMKMDIPFYTVSVNDSTFYQRYKISGVPVTILISGDATVEGLWKGELDDGQVNEIASRASVNTTALLIQR
jgi:peroxiredoxin